MKIIEITDPDAEPLQIYGRLTESQLLNRLHPEKSLFIAESPKVIRVALQQGYQPVSMLCERKHITGDAAPLWELSPAEMPVYTAEREILARLTGYTLTRGVLCAMRRPASPTPSEVLYGASRVCVIDGVTDTTNIGSIFRSAAALGIDAVMLTRTSCDPFNRRSIRVSMGSVFLVPWTWIDDPNEDMHHYGFKTAAMALRKDNIRLDDPALSSEKRLAIIMGTEGEGLAENVINGADHVVMIPMAHNVDSLNVGAAAAVAFWQLRKQYSVSHF
ncbi:MAG: RNA methyltransferase [Muribaculaceae bacterium]|nr:RNA methyltransferase [Muribaculaceae bacterium]